MNNNEPPFHILGQYVKDKTFENPGVARFVMGQTMQAEPEVTVEASVSFTDAKPSERIFETSLFVGVKAIENNEVVFIAEMIYGCLVKVNASCADEHIEPMLLVDVPFYLFLETRNIIASMVWQGGYSPLFISPIDFVTLYQQRAAAQINA